MSEEMREAVSDVIAVAADFYERLQIDVTFTERGVEIDTDMSLAD
jgi:NAD(P)H-nitrite reductase large subunit